MEEDNRKKRCHCEPALKLAWQSVSMQAIGLHVPMAHKGPSALRASGGTDCEEHDFMSHAPRNDILF